MLRVIVYTLVSFAVLLSAAAGPRDVPLAVSYQGQLLDSSGAPRNGKMVAVVRILDDPNRGTLIYEEVHTGAAVTDGISNTVHTFSGIGPHVSPIRVMIA